MATPSEEAKLQLFLEWLKVNGAELRGCKIKYCDSSKGFGIFSSNGVANGILLVIPLDLAITPMSVLEDPLIGPECRLMYEQGEEDDRFLMMLFLTVERLRKNSTWKPYLDMLPTEFGNPLWFTDEELLELKGTTLHKATEIQTDLKAAATWEVDGSGSSTGKPFSMYLLSAGNIPPQGENEISISYGDKGNEELLYLYGFVMKDNPDDYLMIHYSVDAILETPFSEDKLHLLGAQKGELRCLLPRSLLNNGFFPEESRGTNSKCFDTQAFNYSWSGNRKIPSYANKLVFPETFLCALRAVTMKESELHQVASMLEELVGSEGERQPSETEVRTAIWEACGDSGALQLLVDLLNMKMAELKEGSGTEESDSELLNKAYIGKIEDDKSNGSVSMSRNRWASIVYRRGQKQLTRRFLLEAEHALQLALSED